MDELNQFVLESVSFLPQLAMEHTRIVDVELFAPLIVQGSLVLFHDDVTVAGGLRGIVFAFLGSSCTALLAFALAETEYFDQELNEQTLDVSAGDHCMCQ